MELFPDIDKFTKSDFLDGEKPYECAMLYNDDEFELSRITAKLTEAAKKVGVRNFMTIWGKYRKAHGGTEDDCGVTNFPEQPITLMCGAYICDARGVRSKNDTVCPHPIMPVRRLCNIDTGVEKLEIAFSRGRGWRKAIFDREIIATRNKIVALSNLGIAVTSENAQELVSYFAKLEALNPEIIPEIECVTRLGWVKGENGDDFVPYVKNVVFDGEGEYKKHFEAVTSKCDPEEYIRFIKKNIRQNNVIARTVYASALASPLIKPLGCNCFWIHLWGESESAKTVLAMCAASVWGNPEIGAYIATFNGTNVGMEKTSAFYNNLPFVLDELQIVADKKDFDNLIYMLTEGCGRSRGNKQGGLDAIPQWKNAVITTGEKPICTQRSGGGSQNRVLEVECTEKFFTVIEPREVANFVKSNYGFLGRLFIAYLKDDGMLEKADSLLNSYYKTLVSDYGVTQKQAQSAALILTADKLVTDMVFDDGKELTCAEIAEFLKRKDEVSANPRAYEYVCSYVAANQRNFTGTYESGEIFGVIEGEKVYIIKTKFDAICDEGGYSSASLLSWLDANGKLCKGSVTSRKENRKTVLKKLNAIPIRCVCLVIDAEDASDADEIDF